MDRISNIEPVYCESIPEHLESGKIYISEKYKTASHLCACGCGNIVVTPLSGGTVWKLNKNADGTISLSGSIGNKYFECKSHYFIENNAIRFDNN